MLCLFSKLITKFKEGVNIIALKIKKESLKL